MAERIRFGCREDVMKAGGRFQRPPGLYFLGLRRASRRGAVGPSAVGATASGASAVGPGAVRSPAFRSGAIGRRHHRRTSLACGLATAIALSLGVALGCGGADDPGSGRRGQASAEATPADVARSGDQDGRDARPAPAEPASRRDDRRPTIVFLGTSLTAGYGLPEEEAFPARIQSRIEARGLDYRVVNAGVSGDTSAGGLRRLDWLLRLPIAVLVVELGANDMLRGQSVEALRENLDAILERTRDAHPEARFLIAGMRAAPNLGPRYAKSFDAVYSALAERWDAALVPFLLEGVAAVRRLNQADGIHPTAEGHALIADRIWERLAPLLR